MRVVPKGCRVFGHDASAAFYCSTSVPGASFQAAHKRRVFCVISGNGSRLNCLVNTVCSTGRAHLQGILHRRKDPHERTKFQHSDPTQDKHKESDIHARLFPILARVASVTAVLMYVFYFPQIIDNINSHKGNWIQPLVAGINCTLWVACGLWREKKD